ncbi:pitrilysin family protein [uncultured Microscilla sp.]|uniref:M16 family metallopeptidase n=1 Tax=uncultured Microscilla sp. TaxID=432653 RepID=UPI00261D7E30|nr:pitrilysin family protein [uncultured Microscilla sp.]
MKKILWLSCLLLFALLAQAQTKVEDVKTLTLKNGMKVIVLEDHSIPNANMYLFWKVGSRNERPGITGLSHFFEHMMFNGAKKYGPKMFDRVMEANGGSNNAYTTEDVTVYTDWFPSSSIEVMFDLEADRIGALNISSKMLESERGVVLSERSTGLENSNFQSLQAQLKSTAFFAHAYRWPVIGYESDIKQWTKKDLEDYFKTYYAPNNCVVVIVGDVTLAQVKKLSAKYFEPIPGNTPPAKVRTVEPPQNGEKRVVVHKKISSPNVALAYHVPSTSSQDYYALDMLSSILSSGNSSRLRKSLIFDQQVASAIFTYMPQSFDPNLFYLYGVAARNITPEKLEAAMLAEIEKIQEKGVTDFELQKTKNQKLMGFYQQMETINGKANSIGTYELFFGSYTKLFNAPKLYENVTKEDIQRVAKKYFIKTNRTVGYLLSPEKKGKSK